MTTMSVLSWNIQFGLGVDGVLDLRRVVDTALAMGPIDVLCLQEVAVNFDEMGGGLDVDQPAALAALLPGFTAHFGACVDILAPGGGRRQRFGNMILSRLPVLDIAMQPLPRPSEPGVVHMPRGALWAVVEGPRGPLRIASTHLEFHSGRQRLAQVRALRCFHAEAAANDRHPPATGPGPYRLRPTPIGTAICGDFNFTTDEAPYSAMLAADGGETLRDAWVSFRPGVAHPPTCGIHDRKQWPQGPHARDFVFLSTGLATAIVDVAVDTATAASDHQPVRITLAA